MIYLWFNGDFVQSNTAVDMMRHLSPHLCSSPVWTNTRREWNHKQNIKRTGKAKKYIIRKTICLFLFPSLSFLVCLSSCLASSSLSLSRHLITQKSNYIKLHFTGHIVPSGLPFQLPKRENGKWCINWFIPLWPNHSDNVTTKFHNCSEWLNSVFTGASRWLGEGSSWCFALIFILSYSFYCSNNREI